MRMVDYVSAHALQIPSDTVSVLRSNSFDGTLLSLYFKGAGFQDECRLLCETWYLTDKLSSRNLLEMTNAGSALSAIYGVWRALLTIATKSEKLYGLWSTARAPASIARWYISSVIFPEYRMKGMESK